MNLKETLANLLAERKELRQLSADLNRFHLMANREQVKETEQRISDLVTGLLTLTKYESITPWILAEAVQSLLSYLGAIVYYDEPAKHYSRATMEGSRLFRMGYRVLLLMQRSGDQLNLRCLTAIAAGNKPLLKGRRVPE
jgi:hypothetical protein